jgi:hypothetical protein
MAKKFDTNQASEKLLANAIFSQYKGYRELGVVFEVESFPEKVIKSMITRVPKSFVKRVSDQFIRMLSEQCHSQQQH